MGRRARAPGGWVCLRARWRAHSIAHAAEHPLHTRPPAPSCSGIINIQGLGTWAWASYTAVLGVIVFVGLGRDANRFIKARRRSQPEMPATK